VGVHPVGISVDASFEKTEAGSYVVMQVWGRQGSGFYLLDQVRERWEFTDTVDALEALIKKWPSARAKWIEKKANGAAIISTLKKKIPGLIPVNPTGSKEARLQAVSPLWEAGNVHLPKKAKWIGTYVTEVTTFPNAKNDDQVDATSQALLKMSTSSMTFGGHLPL
jgi:predicted phage terminase large subunit-like protein